MTASGAARRQPLREQSNHTSRAANSLTFCKCRVMSYAKVLYTVEEDIQLAECVRAHPCLYDLKNANYKDQQIRDNVWKLISNSLNKKSVDDCKKRWKNMKDTYNKNKRSRKLGTGSSTKNKQKKWVLADALSFLDVCFYERTGLTNFNSTNEIKNSKEEDSLTVTVDDENNSSNLNDFSIMSATETTTVHDTELENNFNTEKKYLTLKKKLSKEKIPTKKLNQNKELVSLLKRSNEERQQILNSINKVEEEEDPIDAFFKTMAITVKSFPQHLKIKAKKEVFNIITNLEIENSSTSSTQNRNIPSSSSYSSPNSSLQSSSHSGFSTYDRPSQYVFPDITDRQPGSWIQPFGEQNCEPFQYDDRQCE
ncbi:uncharacterized protein LOC126896916 [Daktulosphaira vitifoliae]|uniref:uncharacterized protein LOC126896916 n=1 Tax=Daktulosphaira vitifoliae TaxID=58002 RepID=UPI0021A99D2A|nr:uncharacterized protein LOC126896916 [Daktulosphaira vitifoliae]